ncbi:MAG TPA: TIGR03086 family metal-binding protein [Actinomycetes bacterium]|nr:TIGR03086 family metal-binding protein [Actinomycetes bacterium]
MTEDRAAAAPLGGVALLERAIGYTLGSLHLVTPEAMSRSSPCRDWDLRALLAHMDDALVALREAAERAHVDMDGPGAAGAPRDGLDPVARLRVHGCRLLGAWTRADAGRRISIGGRTLPASVLTTAGALEVAVHGWDVARACGRRRPVPEALALELLVIAPLLVTEADRGVRFAPPVDLPSSAGASDQLIAYLGRDPR